MLVLLAVTVGTPDLARALLAKIRCAPTGDDIITVLRKPAPNREATLSEVRDAALTRIGDVLEEIREHTPLISNIDEYQRWGPHVARFSFYTRELTYDTASR